MPLVNDYIILAQAGPKHQSDARRIRRVLSKTQKHAADRILRAKAGLRRIVVTS